MPAVRHPVILKLCSEASEPKIRAVAARIFKFHVDISAKEKWNAPVKRVAELGIGCLACQVAIRIIVIAKQGTCIGHAECNRGRCRAVRLP